MDAWVRYYPRDVFPTLWERIDVLIDNGQLLAIDEVLRELEKKVDDLHEWATQRKELFVTMDAEILRRGGEVINQFPSLVDPEKLRGTADPFVIALAAERNLTVVTAEKPKPSKPKIPDVCQALKVPCISLIELFRRERWTV
jgi:hypothetical protein